MRQITFFLFMLLTVTFSFGQTLPVDFESAEDDAFEAFNGAAAAAVTDPTDASNTVLELVSNGDGFDGATLTMATYVDLSDDANNTITMEFWTPDATTRSHLLQLRGATGASPQIQLYFDTTAAGWQTVTLNFSDAGPTLSDNYFLIDLFADAGDGNTATGTYYIDDIDGPNGGAVPVDPVPATAAPIPSYPDSEVYSIFNDTNNYSTVFPIVYGFGSVAGTPDLDDSDDVNVAYKYNFGLDGFGQGEGGPDDVSAYNFVTFDYWAEDGLTGFDVVMINQGAEYVYQVGVDEAIVSETWVKVEIPMSHFTDLGFNSASFFQWKMGPLDNSVDNAGIGYIDNILLTENTLSSETFNAAEFNAYPNPTNDVWNIQTTENIETVQIFNTVGRLVKEVKVNGNTTRINANDLSAGIYFAKISNEFNQTKTIKLVRN